MLGVAYLVHKSVQDRVIPSSGRHVAHDLGIDGGAATWVYVGSEMPSQLAIVLSSDCTEKRSLLREQYSMREGGIL